MATFKLVFGNQSAAFRLAKEWFATAAHPWAGTLTKKSPLIACKRFEMSVSMNVELLSTTCA